MEKKNEKEIERDNFETKAIDLIDGIFDAEEAGKMLLSLTNSKINYHTVETLRSMELFGIENVNSKKRISDLRNANTEINKMLYVAAEMNKKMKIKAVINISYE